MTEDDAKTKWCPYTWRVSLNTESRINKGNCMGSACMMWVWEPTTIREGHITIKRWDKVNGYCGLCRK